MPGLRKNLGLTEAVGLSLSIIAPTMAMAFNVSLAVQAAGAAAPLAFAIGTVVLAVVGLSFVAFSRRVAHSGSAYAFIGHAFGPRWGFVAGWALLLTYAAYAAGTAALVGNFIDAGLSNYGLKLPWLWVVLSILAVAAAMWFAFRDMKLAARLMLALEAVSVLAIVVLAAVVLRAVAAKGGLSSAPFRPGAGSGWSGVGYGMVFAVLSFAGFEGAATLGEETDNPRRNIPAAIFGTVILAGIFYVFVSYAQVVGYGLDHMKDLAGADAPLNTLSVRYVSTGFATAIDLAAAVSAFSCVLGSVSAASRMLFALGRAGLMPRMGLAHPVHGTPAAAVLVVGALCIVGMIFWAPVSGAGNYYGYMGTIGTLALILVYMGVTGAEMAEAFRGRRLIWGVSGLAGTVLLLWPLYNSIVPVPGYPNNLWPYLVAAWLLCGGALLLLRPAVARAGVAALQAEG